MSHKDFKPGDKVSRKDALVDFGDDWVRLWNDVIVEASHIGTDMVVNLLRVAGVSDRNKSQDYGRIVAKVVLGIVVVALVVSWWA